VYRSDVGEEILQILAGPSPVSSDARRKVALLIGLRELDGDELLRDLPKLLALHQLVAAHDTAAGAMLSIHYNLCMGTIKSLGNKSPYTRDIYSQLSQGRALGVYLATEIAYGNNLAALETEACYQPEQRVFILRSPTPRSYKFMPNTVRGDLPKVAIVMARLIVGGKKYGIVPFLLPLEVDGKIRRGVRISPLGDKPGFHLDNAITSFDNVEIPFEALLAENILEIETDGSVHLHEPKAHNRFLKAINRVQVGKLCMASTSLGMSKAALCITMHYAQKRRTFGAFGSIPIIRYHVLRDGLIVDVGLLVVFSLWLDHLVARLVAESEGRPFDSEIPEQTLNEIAIAKATISWHAQELLVRCRERCGAQGLFSANRIIDYYLGNNGVVTAECDNQVIMLKAARYLLYAEPSALEPTIPPALRSLWEPIRRYYFWLETSLRQALDDALPETRFSIWNQNGNHVLRLAQVFGICEAVRSTFRDTNDQTLPELVAELFLLYWVRMFSSELLMAEIITIPQARAIDERWKQLLHQQGDAILDMIAEFGIEAAHITTPISSADYVSWYADQHLSFQE
jgi:acyl-CoA oxidase